MSYMYMIAYDCMVLKIGYKMARSSTIQIPLVLLTRDTGHKALCPVSP